MSFKKFNEMELAMLASIATMTEYTAHRIARENGDLTPVVDEDCISAPEFSYLNKPNAVRHAIRRKETFKKKAEQKETARDLGYDLFTENNSKKVKALLSANHADRKYFRGEKADKKYLTVQEELTLMEKEQEEDYYENVALARENMMEHHDAILSSIGLDIIDLKMDLKCNDYDISNVEEELEILRKEMEEASKKLQTAMLKRNGLMAAIREKEETFKKVYEVTEAERISKFGW